MLHVLLIYLTGGYFIYGGDTVETRYIVLKADKLDMEKLRKIKAVSKIVTVKKGKFKIYIRKGKILHEDELRKLIGDAEYEIDIPKRE